jgi:hypothetical protein
MDLLASMIEAGEPPLSAKEAVGALGQLRQSPAEQALLDRLRRLEGELQARGGHPDGWEMADRICAALARQGSPRAVRAITAHAFNKSPALGDALARFEHLSRMDLTIDPEQLAVLVTSIRELAPAKVLGFVPKKNQHELVCLMNAVVGNADSEVRNALGAVAEPLSSPMFSASKRARALAKLEPRARVHDEALTGDLELFGLRNLIQTLSTSDSSGELVLFDAGSTRRGAIAFSKGKLARAEAGKLSDEVALYALMGAPIPRNVRLPAGHRRARSRHREDVSTRCRSSWKARARHDEYQRARAFAVDGVRYEPAGVPAVRPGTRATGNLPAASGTKAAAGTPANICEAETPVDPFRVRRLYAHWVETRAPPAARRIRGELRLLPLGGPCLHYSRDLSNGRRSMAKTTSKKKAAKPARKTTKKTAKKAGATGAMSEAAMMAQWQSAMTPVLPTSASTCSWASSRRRPSSSWHPAFHRWFTKAHPTIDGCSAGATSNRLTAVWRWVCPSKGSATRATTIRASATSAPGWTRSARA